LLGRDASGGLTLRFYYSVNGGIREGFLQRERRQQARWTLGLSAPDTASIRWTQGWTVNPNYRVSDDVPGHGIEIDFYGSGLVLYQDDGGDALHGDQPAVSISLLDSAGAVRVLPSWDQINQPSYEVSDLPSGTYTLTLRNTAGHRMALGRIDVFQETSYEISEAGLITAVTNPRGFRSVTIIDELDRAVATIAPPPFSYRTYTAYDGSGRIVSQFQELDPPIVGNHFLRSSYLYDAQDNRLGESVGGEQSSPQVTLHRYDNSDRRIATVLPRGNVIRYSYDERGLAVEVIRAACTPDEARTRTIYDGDGRKIGLVNPLGSLTRYAYDTFGRAILVQDALGNIQRTRYDKLNNVEAYYFFGMKDGMFFLLTKRAYDYDERGRKRRLVDYLFRDPIAVEQFDPRDINQNPDDPHDFPEWQRAYSVQTIMVSIRRIQ
jgi:YD repeat-containing protein